MAIEQFALDMDAESKAAQRNPAPQGSAMSATEIASAISAQLKADGIDDELNPIAAEKIARDRDYMRQIEQHPLPEGAPEPVEPTTPGLDRLDQLAQDKENLERELAKWKTYYGRSESRMGGLKERMAELEARVAQTQPYVDVRQVTGKGPEDILTAQEIVNLLMSQSQAFGKTLSQMKEEMVLAVRNPDESKIPVEVEAELLQSHPWLANLALPQKERAMADLMASLGKPVVQRPAAQTAANPDLGRAPVKQPPFIEPSNRGSAAERHAIAPERQALNEKISKLKEALGKPGGSKQAEELLAALGVGAVDESQVGFLNSIR